MHHSKRVLAQLVWGFFAGALVGAIYFLIEPAGVLRDVRWFFGVSFLEVYVVYMAFGMGAGVLAALLLLVVRPRRRPDAASLLAVLGSVFTILFLVRAQTVAELRTLPAGIVVGVAVAVIVWGAVFALGVRSGRFALPSQPGVMTVAFLVALGALAGPALVLRAREARIPERSGARADAPNIVMIVVDALRRDHLGAYGYQRPTSPTMDALAGEGVRFDNAYSHGNRTIIAMPSLFTSLYPSFHGAIGLSEEAAPLPPARTTIAEVLQAAGYRTVGLMSNIYLKRPFGMTQGFDRTEEFDVARFYLSVYRVLDKLGLVHKPAQKASTEDAAVVTDAALSWLARMDDAPYFLYVHYMDVHHPYMPPPEVFSEFDRGTATASPDTMFKWTVQLLRTPPPLAFPEGARERLIDYYDACIRYTDANIARVVAGVREHDNGRPTIVVITSDHGDEFFEHGSVYHNNVLIEELIRVPLIFWRSDGAWQPRAVQGMARHIDVLPTLADIAGGRAAPEVAGVSLAGTLMNGAGTGVDRSISEGDYCVAMNTPDWKVMYVDTSSHFSLYDLSTDRYAYVDVSDAHPERFDTLRGELERYMADAAEVRRTADQTVDEETLRQLRALGYVR